MSVAANATLYDCARLAAVFRECFGQSENTELRGGADEPLYLPAGAEQSSNLLYFREDYFASALHEIAHWCIAGVERRKQVDFGYWYAPEGRSSHQQKAFEAVEIKPQALEWLFSLACAYPFQVSVDNFGPEGELVETTGFRRAVAEQASHWQQAGLPERAQQFFDALVVEFASGVNLSELVFDPEGIA